MNVKKLMPITLKPSTQIIKEGKHLTSTKRNLQIKEDRNVTFRHIHTKNTYLTHKTYPTISSLRKKHKLNKSFSITQARTNIKNTV